MDGVEDRASRIRDEEAVVAWAALLAFSMVVVEKLGLQVVERVGL